MDNTMKILDGYLDSIIEQVAEIRKHLAPHVVVSLSEEELEGLVAAARVADASVDEILNAFEPL